MSKYDVILFDLDGTLTDPCEGITNSVAYALGKFDIYVTDKKELYKFIGPTLKDSFMEFYGFSEEKARKAIAFYREYFTAKGMLENAVYDGMEEMLEALLAAGKRLAVATSKPEVFAVKILEYFGLAHYFEYIAGATLDETRTKKQDVIEYALGNLKFADRAKVLMVGDRRQDVAGAHACSVDCIGVLFGYGGREELAAAGADYIAETVGDIARIILQ